MWHVRNIDAVRGGHERNVIISGTCTHRKLSRLVVQILCEVGDIIYNEGHMYTFCVSGKSWCVTQGIVEVFPMQR